MLFSITLDLALPSLDYDVLWEALAILGASPVNPPGRRQWLLQTPRPTTSDAVRKFLVPYIRDDDWIVVRDIQADASPRQPLKAGLVAKPRANRAGGLSQT